jgi:hypothetical protein
MTRHGLRRLFVSASAGLAATGWLLVTSRRVGGTGQVGEVLLTTAVVWPIITVGVLVALAIALPRRAEV